MESIRSVSNLPSDWELFECRNVDNVQNLSHFQD